MQAPPPSGTLSPEQLAGVTQLLLESKICPARQHLFPETLFGFEVGHLQTPPTRILSPEQLVGGGGLTQLPPCKTNPLGH